MVNLIILRLYVPIEIHLMHVKNRKLYIDLVAYKYRGYTELIERVE
jgi:hypothetical protein